MLFCHLLDIARLLKFTDYYSQDVGCNNANLELKFDLDKCKSELDEVRRKRVIFNHHLKRHTEYSIYLL